MWYNHDVVLVPSIFIYVSTYPPKKKDMMSWFLSHLWNEVANCIQFQHCLWHFYNATSSSTTTTFAQRPKVLQWGASWSSWKFQNHCEVQGLIVEVHSQDSTTVGRVVVMKISWFFLGVMELRIRFGVVIGREMYIINIICILWWKFNYD